jgi:hypothetical protein
MNRAVLERPFPSEVVKSRKGSFGSIAYVEAVHYIRRLNEAFDGDWNWTIHSHQIDGTEVIVHGVIEAGGVIRHAFGGSHVTTNKTTGEVVSLGDDLKAAATDALKKACSLLGIGLELYGGISEDIPAEGAPATMKPADATARPPLRAVPSDTPVAPGNRLTAKQLKAIYAIATASGLSDGDLKRACRDSFGVMPEFLSKRDASAFITTLSAR